MIAEDVSEMEVEEGETASSDRKLIGFARLSPERRREIARLGGLTTHARGVGHCFDSESGRRAGRVAHERGTARVWTPETAREAGRKGGKAFQAKAARGRASKP